MKEAIQQRARKLGFDACRFTTALPPTTTAHFERCLAKGCHGEMSYLKRNSHKRADPQRVLAGAKSVIAVAVSYAPVGDRRVTSNASCASATGHPSLATCHAFIARYARFKDYHDVLTTPMRTLTEFVNQLGGEGTRSLWYADTGPVLERDLAQRAGLGFIGKHTNLISRQLGNWILLGEIITSLELEPDSPERNRCGSCARCIAACPAQAITAPFQLDARRCISYLTIELQGPIPLELRPAIGNRFFGCDDCLAVCPWNKFAREGRLMKAHARPGLAAPDLLELLSLNDAGYKNRFGDTPLRRAKRHSLLRNVCVALGNVGDETALPKLERAAADPEPLVAEHARWAIEQIQKRAQH